VHLIKNWLSVNFFFKTISENINYKLKKPFCKIIFGEKKIMEKLQSEGKCVYCEQKYSQSGMGRHLNTHLKKLEKETSVKGTAFHLYIPVSEMFLHLLVNGTKTLGDLDSYLRAIWLECCGHMSAFKVKGKEYAFDIDATAFGEKMSQKVGKVFTKGQTLQYDYDYGSTTSFEIKVVDEYNLKVPKGILLLSRNEPLPILCHSCQKKPAVAICSVHMYEGECLFCKSCAKKHEKSCPDFEDYANISVVNSPRMGVCAYDGGTIDLERDGVWKG